MQKTIAQRFRAARVTPLKVRAGQSGSPKTKLANTSTKSSRLGHKTVCRMDWVAEKDFPKGRRRGHDDRLTTTGEFVAVVTVVTIVIKTEEDL
jgi:hypothetical protein